jgi:hypothetical protein
MIRCDIYDIKDKCKINVGEFDRVPIKGDFIECLGGCFYEVVVVCLYNNMNNITTADIYVNLNNKFE